MEHLVAAVSTVIFWRLLRVRKRGELHTGPKPLRLLLLVALGTVVPSVFGCLLASAGKFKMLSMLQTEHL